jgi:hypothetical protein
LRELSKAGFVSFYPVPQLLLLLLMAGTLKSSSASKKIPILPCMDHGIENLKLPIAMNEAVTTYGNKLFL